MDCLLCIPVTAVTARIVNFKIPRKPRHNDEYWIFSKMMLTQTQALSVTLELTQALRLSRHFSHLHQGLLFSSWAHAAGFLFQAISTCFRAQGDAVHQGARQLFEHIPPRLQQVHNVADLKIPHQSAGDIPSPMCREYAAAEPLEEKMAEKIFAGIIRLERSQRRRCSI